MKHENARKIIADTILGDRVSLEDIGVALAALVLFERGDNSAAHTQLATAYHSCQSIFGRGLFRSVGFALRRAA